MRPQIKKTILHIMLAFAVYTTSSFAMKNDDSDDEKKDEYTRLTYVANKFLDSKKTKHLKKSKKNKEAIKQLKDFKMLYNERDDKAKNFVIDLTGLSARARIHILRELIEHKLMQLPQYDVQNYYDFKKLKIESNGWWHKDIVTEKWQIVDFTDEFPVMLKIGKFEYKFQLGPTLHQKGGGKIYGLQTKNRADSYNQVSGWLKKKKSSLPKFSKKILKQKRNGKPIDSEEYSINKYLNGLNLLLDYEVARRLISGDPHEKLPVISFLPEMTDLTKFDKLFLKKEKNASLVAGGNEISKWCTKTREDFAKEVALELNCTGSSKLVRHKLRFLHHPEEDSGDEYSGDEYSDDEENESEVKKYLEKERNRLVQKLKKYGIKKTEKNEQEEIKEFVQKVLFLVSVVERYIAGIRNDSWGGGIELRAIADVENLRINVYGPAGLITTVTPDNNTYNHAINLWLSGRHYQNYNPNTHETSFVPADGHCLYRSVVREMAANIQNANELEEEDESEEEEGVVDEGTRINLLRQATANNIDGNDAIANQIRQLFASVLNAENLLQVIDGIQDLSPDHINLLITSNLLPEETIEIIHFFIGSKNNNYDNKYLDERNYRSFQK